MWGDVSYYTPEADEVIILNDVYDADATAAGYSTHTAIQWGGTASPTNKTVGNPAGTPVTISDAPSFPTKGNGKGKNITINITSVSKIIVYHESHASRFIELRSESKSGTLIGSGSTDTYYTEVNLTGTTNYSIFLHGTAGTDDQDFYVYAIKLIKYGASKTPSDLTITSGTTLILEKDETSTITHTTSSSGAISYTSTDEDVATVTSAGVITAVGGGKTKITVSQVADATYAAGSKVVNVNVPYDNPDAADTYTLTHPELSFSNAAQTTHYFTNGFTITTDAADGMQYAGIESNTGIKYSHVRTYTINTPSNVTATYLEIKARSNYPNGTAANWGTVLGEDYSDEALPYSGEEPQTKYFQIASPAEGAYLSFSPGGNQWQGYITVHTNAWVAATAVGLNKTSTDIVIGKTETLTPTFIPSTASNKNVSWASDDEDVATVSNGVVTAVAVGTATITATTEDGSFTATCEVTVKEKTGDDVTFNLKNSSFVVSGDGTTQDGINFTSTGAASSDYLNFSTSSGGQTITIAGSGNKRITKVVLTYTASDNDRTGGGTDLTVSPNDAGYSISSKTGTWTSANAAGDATVTFTTADKARVEKVVVTYIITASVSLGEYEWVTFVSDKALDFTGSDVKAYVITGHTGTAVDKNNDVKKVPANTPLLLNAPEGTYYVPVTADPGTISTNLLHAGDGSAIGYVDNKTRYVLGVSGSGAAEFQKIVDGGVSATVPVGKAYLEFDEEIDFAPSALRLEDEENNATDLESFKVQDSSFKFIENGKLLIMRDGVTYDALGRVVR